MTPNLTSLAGWTAAALVFALGLEVAARVDDWRAFGASPWVGYDSDDLRAKDDAGIPRNVPGARFEKWRINAAGFRGPELERQKAPGRRRVVVLGQSESFGLYESPGGEWPERLRRLVEAEAPAVEVINASVVGTARRSRIPYLERYVLPLAPDAVVLVPNVYNEASASGRADGEAPLRPDPPAAPGLRPPQSRALGKLRLQAKAFVPDRLWAAVHDWRFARRLAALQAEALGGRPLLDATPPEYAAGYRAHLLEVVALLRARGIQPVVATYPTAARAGNRAQFGQALTEQREWLIQFSEAGLLDVAAAMNQVTRQVAAEAGVPLADLDAAVPPTAEHFADLVHYTDAGAEVVARAALLALRQAGLLAPPAAAQ